MMFVEPEFGCVEFGDGGLGGLELLLCRFSSGGRVVDGSTEACGLGIDRLDLRAQIVDLALQSGQPFASVGDCPYRGEMGLRRSGRGLLPVGESLFGFVEHQRRVIDRVGQCRLFFRCDSCLALEFIGVATGVGLHGFTEVPAALVGDPARGADAFGQRRQGKPRLTGLVRRGHDLSQVFLVLTHLSVQFIELVRVLVLLTAQFGFTGALLGEFGASGHEIVCRKPQLGVTQVCLDCLGTAGDLGLATERLELAAQFRGQVTEPCQVGLHRVELADGLFLAFAVFENAGSFFDERPAFLRSRLQDRGEAPLSHDHMHLATDAGVAEELLHVHQSARTAIDLVLTSPVAEHPAGHRHLGVVDGQCTIGVVDGEGHLGPPEWGATGGAGEDDVLHLAAAQRLRALLPHHPRERVDNVRLARTVGTDHAGDPRFETQSGCRRKGLEALQGQALEVHSASAYPVPGDNWSRPDREPAHRSTNPDNPPRGALRSTTTVSTRPGL